MTLRQTKRVITTLAICAITCAVLAYLVNKLAIAFLLVMIVLYVAVVAVNLIFWRCPYCEKHLGRDSGKYCQHCGKELDLDL